MRLTIKLVSALALASLFSRFGWSYDEVRYGKPIKLDDVQEPSRLAVSESRIYVIDERKSALYIYDLQGKLLKSVGRSGSSDTAFSGPKDVAVAPPEAGAKRSGPTVYVADTDNSRIQVLDADGNFLLSFGSKGSGPGEMKYPQSVAVGSDGRVYVSDTENNRIEVFTRDGIFLDAFGGRGPEQGNFRNTYRVEVDPADFVYVHDYGNGRIQKFSPKFKFAKEFNLIGTNFALDPFGFMYMMDPKSSKVREMGPDGSISGTFGRRPEKAGIGKGQFNEIADVRAGRDGSLWVLDRGEKNVVRVEITSKLKTDTLARNTESRILLSGPVQAWPISATVMSTGDDGMVYACLTKSGQMVAIDSDGKTKLAFGKKGKDKSSTRECRGIAASGDHGIFVSDAGGDKMQNFDTGGKFNSVFADATGFFDSKKKEGRVRNPQGAAINEKGTLYVADSGNHRVDAFSPDGTFLFSFGPQIGSFELQNPVSVAWDKSGFVYVLDRKLKKVFKCQPSGGLVTSWGAEGFGPGEFQDPVSLAFDGNDYVYVLDAGQRRVSAFTKDGAWMSDFLSYGSDDRRLDTPESITVNGDRLLVSDSAKGKIFVFALHPRITPPEGLAGSAVEGEVILRWKAAAENWASTYQILRSTSAIGPFEAIGAAEKEFKDGKVQTYQTYYYRAATQAKTKDIGPASAQTSVFIQGAFNRAPVEIASVDIGNIFSANYKYYKENPIGKIVLTNNVNVPFENVKVTFRLKEFMDFGTDSVIPKLEPQQKVDVPLKAVLNNHILSVTEDTPIQAEFTLTYFENGKPLSVSLDKPLRVYARNAITWDKPERIVTFITSNDTPIKDFRAKVFNQEVLDVAGADSLNTPLTKAIMLWSALGGIGMKYQPAPNSPFEEVSKDPTFPEDYTQFPRETLKLKSGQCDDLATMISAMLESAGVKTALLDYPGHIALMFDTGSSDPADVGLPESQMIHYADTYWIPVEATLVGAPFAEAHRQAVNAYRQMDKRGKANIIDPRKAWALFEPATMPPSDITPDVPNQDDLSKRFSSDAAAFVKDRYDFLQDYYKGQLAQDGKDTDVLNQLALLDVEIGNRDKAAEGFGRVLAIDANDAAALNNLGAIAFIRGDYAKAESMFLKSSERDPEDPGVWLNLAKSAAKQKKGDKVKEFGDKASALDPKNSDLQTAVQSLR